MLRWILSLSKLRKGATYAPLPRCGDIIRSIVSASIDTVELSNLWRRNGELAGMLSRSAWSLALVAQWRLRFKSSLSIPRVWIPDFFCNSALVPLRETGVEVVFYSVDQDLQPDYEDCSLLANKMPPDIFLFVHYFGEPRSAKRAFDFCTLYGAWLIEDAAHVLQPIDGVGEYGDFVLYSPHKLLPIQDGAVLVVRSEGPGGLGANGVSYLGDPRTWGAQLVSLYEKLNILKSSLKEYSIVWVLKRILQKCGIGTRGDYIPFDGDFVKKEKSLIFLPHPTMSKLSNRLLSVLLPTINEVALLRKRNLQRLNKFLLEVVSMAHLNSESSLNACQQQWTPYILRYEGECADVRRAYETLHRRGIHVMTWPDLPPEVYSDQTNHRVAWGIRNKSLYLPCHQSITF